MSLRAGSVVGRVAVRAEEALPPELGVAPGWVVMVLVVSEERGIHRRYVDVASGVTVAEIEQVSMSAHLGFRPHLRQQARDFQLDMETYQVVAEKIVQPDSHVLLDGPIYLYQRIGPKVEDRAARVWGQPWLEEQETSTLTYLGGLGVAYKFCEVLGEEILTASDGSPYCLPDCQLPSADTPDDQLLVDGAGELLIPVCTDAETTQTPALGDYPSYP